MVCNDIRSNISTQSALKGQRFGRTLESALSLNSPNPIGHPSQPLESEKIEA